MKKLPRVFSKRLSTCNAMPLWIERGILALEGSYINGGRRGYLVGPEPASLCKLLAAQPVDCVLTESGGAGGRGRFTEPGEP